MINIPQQRVNVDDQVQVRQIAPTLFVGLGGTGGEVVARIKHKMELYFASNPAQQGLAPAIEYMVVDTARFGLLSQTARAVLREDEDFVYIGGIQGEAINNQVRLDPDLGAWFDPNYQAPVDLIDLGANAIRMLARACLLLSARAPQGITARILTKLNRIASLNTGMFNPTCEIYLVAGSGGGTGSGTFWDMAFLLWKHATQRFTVVRTNAFILLPFKQSEYIQRQNPHIAMRVLANAYALFEELELLLQKPDEINNRFMLAKSYRTAGEPPVIGWYPFEQCYLFDHRLDGVGLFEHLDDLYTYMAKSIYHLFLTPYTAQMQAGLANASHILRKGHDTLHHRRTAYSTLGFSSIEYPREIVLHYLQARYAYEMLAKGFLWQGSKMAEIARQHAEGLPFRWVDKLGYGDARDLESRLLKEAESRKERIRLRHDQFLERDRGGQPRTGHYDYGQLSRLGDMVSQTRQGIEAIKQRLEDIFNSNTGAPGAYNKISTEIQNLIVSSPYGLRFAREVLVQVDNLVTNDLVTTRQRIEQLNKELEQIRLKLGADEKTPGSFKQIEGAIARKDNRTLRHHFTTFIQLLSDQLDKEISLAVARLKERFLVAVAGEPQGGTVAVRIREGVVTGHQIEQSLLDEARHRLDELIAQLETLCREADGAMRLRKYYALAGSELTTTYIPDISSPDQLARSQEIEQIFRSVLPNDDAILGEMQMRINQWQNTSAALPKLSALDQPEQVRNRLEQLLREWAHAHFDPMVQKSIWQEVKGMPDRDRQELLSQLVAKATPACPLNTAVLPPTDLGKITYMWAVGGENPGALLQNLPQKFQQGVALAQIPKEQIAILQSAHGFPFHAIKHLSDLQAAYRQMLNSSFSYLHLDRCWNQQGVAVVEGLTQLFSLVDNDTMRVFVLGLFFDRLLRNDLPDISTEAQQRLSELYCAMFCHDARQIGAARPRGLVFYDESRTVYQALRLELARQAQDGCYRIIQPVSLGTVDLTGALSELSKNHAVVLMGVEFLGSFLNRLEHAPEGPNTARGWLVEALDAMQAVIRKRYEEQTMDDQTRQVLNALHGCIVDFVTEYKLRPPAPPVL